MNRRRLPHIGWWMLAIVPLLLMAVSAPFAIDYYRAKRLEALVEAAGGTVKFERRGPAWLWDVAIENGVEGWLSFLQTRLTRVFLDGDSIDDEWLRNLVSYHDIEVLRLENTKVTDHGLLALSSLPGLVALDLTGSDIHGSGLALLKDCPHLAALVLDGCPIQSSMLDPKLTLPELEFFSAEDVAIATLDCQFLSNSPRFYSLWLKGTQVDDRLDKLISQLPQLKWVSLERSRVTDAIVPQLAKLEKLSCLSLSETSVTDRGAQEISEFRQPLEFLELSGTEITDQGTDHFCQLRSLVTLNLSNTRISDETLRRVLNLPHLRSCDLSGTDVTDTGLDSLVDDSLPEREIGIADTAISEDAVARTLGVHPSWEFVRKRLLTQ